MAKGPALAGWKVDNGGGCMNGGQKAYGNFLYFPLDLAVNLKLI